MFLLSLYVLALVSQARPNGAPKCGINEAAIQAGMRTPSDKSLGYALQVTPAGNNNWDITITNSAGRLDYQGILMYVHQISTPANHLGQFSFKNQTKWKFQPAALCNAGNIVSSTPMSTFTHATPDRVAIAKNVTFVWTASASELAINGLVVNAVVASLDPGQSGFARWQHVSFFGIPPTGGSSTNSSTSVGGNVLGTTSTNSSTSVGGNANAPTATTSGAAAAATQTIKVGASGLTYDQPMVNANVGDTIVWTFASSPHTVTQSSDANSCVPMTPGFDSGKMTAPGTFSQVMNATGTIFYMCTVGSHCTAGMKGQIMVSASGSPAGGATGGATGGSANSTTSTPKPNGASGLFGGFSIMAGLVLFAL